LQSPERNDTDHKHKVLVLLENYLYEYNYADDGHSSKETDAESGGSSSTTTLSLEHSHEVTKLLHGPVGEVVSGSKNQGAIPKQRTVVRTLVTGLYSACVWLVNM
jgi:hypothetical protein